MEVIIAFSFALVWFAIQFISGFSKSKYLTTAAQRNNFITALHALIIPLLTFCYLISFPKPFDYEHLVDNNALWILKLCIGFYVFSIINLYLVEKKPQFIMIFHHLVTIVFFVYALYTPEYPMFYMYILVPQCTALVYHTHLIFKETKDDPLAVKRAAFWYELNFYTWIIFRFILQGIFTIAAFYYEFTLYTLPKNVRIITVIGFCFSYFFNLFWLSLLLKKRKERKLKISKYS